MTECSKLGGCPFFNDQMEKMPNIAELLKDQYCRGDFGSCARYRVSEAKGKEAVPKGLYPNDGGDADKLLKKE